MFANTPAPPYYAVIFTSIQTTNLEGYEEELARIIGTVAQQPGFLGFDTARETGALGITVVYFDTLDNIDRWRNNPDHMRAKTQGIARWYQAYRIKIARVETDSAFERP